jgi:putative MATE family efflux protein
VGLLFNEQIFSSFGLVGKTLEYSLEYMNIIYIGLVSLFFTFFAAAILRGEGDSATPTKIISASLILNIILDPIFIYFLGFGVSGAAIATVISRILASVVFAYFLFIKKGSYIEFNLKNFKWNPNILKQIMSVGIPSSLTQMSSAIGVLGTNFILASFGALAIAGFGLFLRIESLVIMPVIGVSIALITMIGMYTGSKDQEKLMSIFNYGNKINVLMMFVAAIIFFFSAEFLIGIFTNSPEVIRIGAEAIRYHVFYFPFGALGFTASTSFQGMGRGKQSFVLGALRVTIAISVAYVLALLLSFGTSGVWLGFVTGNSIAGITGYLWFRVQKIEKSKKSKDKHTEETTKASQ